MSFQFLPFYTGDYFRDTRQLTPLKHGIYFLLLTYCWDTSGPLPLDEQECAQIINCRSADEIDALRYVLARYFVRMADGHYNVRMQKEIEKAKNISLGRSIAGRKGYEARAKHLPSKSQAIASTPTTTTTTTTTATTTKDVPSLERHGKPLPPDGGRTPAVRGTRLAPDWQIPDDWKAWACAAYHLEPQRVVRISLAFRDYWIAKTGRDATKADWQATWRNWVRRELENA